MTVYLDPIIFFLHLYCGYLHFVWVLGKNNKTYQRVVSGGLVLFHLVVCGISGAATLKLLGVD